MRVEVLLFNHKYMMGYGYNYGGMMGGGAFGFGLLTWLLVMIDLVLVGIWLWKQIKKS